MKGGALRVRRNGEGNLRRSSWRLTLATVAIAGVSLALAFSAIAGSRNYLWQATLQANFQFSDLVDHNHYYNLMDTNGSNYPTGIFEQTPNTHEIHYSKNGNGTIDYLHASTYFDHPFCWNRDSIAHFVFACDAEW